jgi:hypothetical protein
MQLGVARSLDGWEAFGPFIVIAILYSAFLRRAGVSAAASNRFFWDCFLIF